MAESRAETEPSSDITTELDKVIPPHQLLDNTAAKHKTELVHRGTLASRHRPSGEGLRTQILRKQMIDSKEASPDIQSDKISLQPPPPPPPSSDISSLSKKFPPKPKPGSSFLADIQSVKRAKCKEDSPSEETELVAEQYKKKEIPTEDCKVDKSPNSPAIKLKPSFLSEIENAKRKKDSEESSKIKDGNIKIKAKPKVNPILMGKSNVQDQLRLKLEARKKLVDETDEGAETEVCS